jgi:hypothetical protein
MVLSLVSLDFVDELQRFSEKELGVVFLDIALADVLMDNLKLLRGSS